MALKYSLEYSSATQDAVYIDLRDNPSIFQDRISKEKYDTLPSAEKDDYLTDIFNIGGVVELAAHSYVIWIMKSSNYDWEEVLSPIIFETSNDLGEGGFSEQLDGSASINGPEDPEICGRISDSGMRRSLIQGVTVEGSSVSFAMSKAVSFTQRPRKHG